MCALIQSTRTTIQSAFITLLFYRIFALLLV